MRTDGPSRPGRLGPPARSADEPRRPSSPGTRAAAHAHPVLAALAEFAAAEGLSLIGVTHPGASAHMPFYEEWLAAGAHGEMAYLSREDSVARRADLKQTMESVRSVAVFADEYGSAGGSEPTTDRSRGIIARYARGSDYHRVLKKKLLRVLRGVDERVEGGVRGRAYVDTGPILERELAQRAGLGWPGRNTMLIHPRVGSYFFLGVLLLDADVPRDEPFAEDRCGTCRACLDACPTGALLGRDESGAPRIDARLCISYLTIELRGSIPEELRSAIGNRIFGCDICQEVCPWNGRFAAVASESAYVARERSADGATPGTDAPSLVDLMRMDEADWMRFTRGSPIRRAGYAGFRRNVAVALGNWLAASDAPDPEAIAVLTEARSDESDLVREHVAWALAQAGPERG